MPKAHGIIFAYETARDLRELVEHRTTSSLPFGGRYRLIDFAVSNMVASGISDIGAIMQRGYQSLLDHLGSGRDWDLNRRVGGLKLLPPLGYTGPGNGYYRNRMDALKGVYKYLTRIRQDYVILCPGNVALNIPLDDVLRQHIDTNADVTVVCTPRPQLPLKYSTFLLPGTDKFMNELVVNPLQKPEGYQSLEIYVLSKELLLETVEHGSTHNFGQSGDFIQAVASGRKTGIYLFYEYVAAITSVKSYYKKSMELLKPQVRQQLFRPDRLIRTKERSDVSTYYGSDSKSKNCLVADGCYIEGTVENCILFRGVRVGQGSILKNCILMQDTVVGDRAILSHVITDKNVEIAPYVTLTGHDRSPITIEKGAKI